MKPRIELIPPKGVLENFYEKMKRVIEDREIRYLNGFELPSPKAVFLIEMVVDDECEVCPLAIEVFTELATLYPQNIELKIYNISYTQPPFEVTATPTVAINKAIKFTGIPLEPDRIQSYIYRYLVHAYVVTHPRLRELLERLERFAKAHGYHRTPRDEHFVNIIAKLLKNLDIYGYPFCPCRPLKLVEGATPEQIYELNKDKVCPCRYVHEDIQRLGHCLCGLFWSSSSFNTYVVNTLSKYAWAINELMKIKEFIDRELSSEDNIKKLIVTGRIKSLLDKLIEELQSIRYSIDEE